MRTAWKPCAVCSKNLNGHINYDRHMEKEHPNDHKRLQLEQRLAIEKRNLEECLQYIASYEQYEQDLCLPLQAATSKLILDRLARWPYAASINGTPGIDKLRWSAQHFFPGEISRLEKELYDASA